MSRIERGPEESAQTNRLQFPDSSTSVPDPGHKASRKIFLLPIILFAVLTAVLGIGLSLDPREVPSPLIGRAVPEFDLPPVKGRISGLASRDLKKEVSLMNVFASWCVACLAEHPVLVDLARRHVVPIHGLNYKDQPDDAARWFDQRGDPYTRTGADIDGRIGIDWGVYGVPETFVIGPDGHIAFKHIGPLTPESFQQKVLPVIERLRRQNSNPLPNPS